MPDFIQNQSYSASGNKGDIHGHPPLFCAVLKFA